MPLVLLGLGCLWPCRSMTVYCPGPEDSEQHTGLHDDTADSIPWVETGDSDTSGETGETAVPPTSTGTFTLSGTLDDAPVTLMCDAPPALVAYWLDSLGNISGSMSCSSGSEYVAVQFIGPSADTWTDTQEGMSWAYDNGAGTVLSYSSPPATSWSLTFSTFEWVDADTVHIAGSGAGTWTGETSADLLISFDVMVLRGG